MKLRRDEKGGSAAAAKTDQGSASAPSWGGLSLESTEEEAPEAPFAVRLGASQF